MKRSLEFAQAGYARPLTFLGVGGMKIFRDDIWGRLRVIFPADHRAFQRMGFYKTFPQASLQNYLMNNFVAPVLNIPKIRRGFNRGVKQGMVQPLKKVVEKAW